MGTLLISKKSIHANKQVKKIQKEYLKQHRRIKGRFPKGKLGKVVYLDDNYCIDATDGIQVNSKGYDISHLSIQEMWRIIKEADLVGLGGSGFSTIKKLETIRKSAASKKYFIINGVACDPGLLHDAWLMEKYMAEVNVGIEIVNKLVGFNEVIMATPDKVPCRYPMGEERILIHTLLGIDITSKEIPAEKGILVLNVQTVLSIYNAVLGEQDQKIRYITVADLDTGRARIARVKMGQEADEVLMRILETNKRTPFLSSTSTDQCYIGSGIMEAEKYHKGQKISAATSLICFGKAFEFHNEEKCKGCGACTRKCPKGIKVHKLVKVIEKEEWSKLEELGIKECIKCGCCSYHCKAGKNIMDMITYAKEKKYER